MYSQTHIDPVVTFRNTQGESLRATIVNLQRNSLVMEVYNPNSILQVSEVLSELTVRLGTKSAYEGKAVVISMVNTGLTAIVSVTLIDVWRELSDMALAPTAVGLEAASFVRDWGKRFQIRRDYQIAVNEMRAYLSEVSRWVDQVDMSDSLPKVDGRLRVDYFQELATPLLQKTQFYLERLEAEAALVEEELAPAHRAYCQSTLHPLILRAPFVFRTYTKPLGYAGDYLMVKQIIDDPQQGPNTYFQIVNTAFLQAAVAVAHRNRIDILVDYLCRIAEHAKTLGRPLRILNVGCGPAFEVQRFLQTSPHPELLSFELVDFSAETLAWTKSELSAIVKRRGKTVEITYTHDSVQSLLKRRVALAGPDAREFDAVYCAGLFDYLSDKVCARLNAHFASRIRAGGKLMVTNVHSDNPTKYGMEHLLDWHLIYRDEAGMEAVLPEQSTGRKIFVDATGVNVFAEVTIN